MKHDNLPELPAGFVRVSGKRKPPRDGLWFIQLRNGFVDKRVAYSRDQLRWVWDGSAGDVVAVAECAGGD